MVLPGSVRAASSSEAGSLQALKAPIQVWYRSSDQCPNGQAFVDMLGTLGRAAALAGVGDRVQFVVTVAYADGRGTGRLERQSSDRTVAIRDVSAASCHEVAEMLALSLDLAVQPGLDQNEDSTVAPVPASGTEGLELHMGLQGTIESGLARAVLPGGAVFLALGPKRRSWEIRLSLRGAHARRNAAVPVNVTLLASRLEACWSWASKDLSLGPCAGWDVGLVVAEARGEGARRGTGTWGAAHAHTRGSIQLWDNFALELQVGVLVPLVSYRFTAAEGGEVTDSASLGVEAALGLTFRL